MFKYSLVLKNHKELGAVETNKKAFFSNEGKIDAMRKAVADVILKY